MIQLLSQVVPVSEMPSTNIQLFGAVILTLLALLGGMGKMVSSHIGRLIECFREDSAQDRKAHAETTDRIVASMNGGFDSLGRKVDRHGKHIVHLAAKLDIPLNQEDSDG